MCSRESHFNVSLTVGDKVKRQCLQLYKLQFSDEKGEPNLNRSPAYKANALITARPNQLILHEQVWKNEAEVKVETGMVFHSWQ